ncbi:MAG: threonine dehydratase [Opitutae bacterium]|nr:threonine dehydratase [Opitutae bacterium]
MDPLPSLAEIEAASPLVNAVVPPTPQFSWPLLNERAGCELWVKHENHTPLGAFKVRGGLLYFANLLKREPGVRGVIAATRGNHGQSVAFAGRRHGLQVVIVVPQGNSPEKNTTMRALGAELIEHGADFQSALEHARKLAVERGLHAMPSFHRDLVSGIAVSTLHFLRTAPVLDTVYVPIGLGSGICAMMAARDALALPTKIVGVVSAHAPMYALSFAARRAVSHPAATRIADGLATSTPNPEALEHILRGVERIVQVTDDETEAAMRAYFTDTHNVAEGAAGAGLAAVLQERAANAGRRVGVVLTGGNVDKSVFARVLQSA